MDENVNLHYHEEWARVPDQEVPCALCGRKLIVRDGLAMQGGTEVVGQNGIQIEVVQELKVYHADCVSTYLHNYADERFVELMNASNDLLEEIVRRGRQAQARNN
jgi:hypothetical protein